ncbi:hypothetical protein RIF29_20258 [Crotalaria pallida]|uniref:Uncharacterized protein n=1 Tax=Crotalaria pallida TaxID=3830 RepID=A0AAN9I8I1_CROPI
MVVRRMVKIIFDKDERARKAKFTNTKGMMAIEVISPPNEAKPVIETNTKSSATDEKENMDQESILMQSISKVKEQLDKLRKENREIKMTLIMFESMNTKEPPKSLTGAQIRKIWT